MLVHDVKRWPSRVRIILLRPSTLLCLSPPEQWRRFPKIDCECHHYHRDTLSLSSCVRRALTLSSPVLDPACQPLQYRPAQSRTVGTRRGQPLIFIVFRAKQSPPDLHHPPPDATAPRLAPRPCLPPSVVSPQ